MRSKGGDFVGILGFIALVLLWVIGSSALVGLVFMLLWNWLAPVFWHPAPSLSFLQAWGLWFLLGMIVSVVKSLFK